MLELRLPRLRNASPTLIELENATSLLCPLHPRVSSHCLDYVDVSLLLLFLMSWKLHGEESRDRQLLPRAEGEDSRKVGIREPSRRTFRLKKSLEGPSDGLLRGTLTLELTNDYEGLYSNFENLQN